LVSERDNVLLVETTELALIEKETCCVVEKVWGIVMVTVEDVSRVGDGSDRVSDEDKTLVTLRDMVRVALV
jgi:hypothetical protein